MHTDPAIFKAYDIRGIYQQQITRKTGYRLGRAFGQWIKKQYQEKNHLEVVVGRDMRDSGQELEHPLVQGLCDESIKVIYIGEVSTPAMYYSVFDRNADGGIVITASHNPSQYNGFKLVKRNAEPISQASGLEEIKELVFQGDFEQEGDENFEQREYFATNTDYIINALTHRQSQIALRSMRIVVDSGNGMASPVIEEFFAQFPQLELIHLYPDLDGDFPNHEANPLKEETLADLKETVKNTQADLGVACDGDFDRIAFVDDTGRTISADITTAFLAPRILQDYPQEPILYDLRSSNIVPEVIEQKGGKSVQTRVGHSFIKAQMREEGAAFAGEYSGHFYFRLSREGRTAYIENPLIALIKMCETISADEERRPASEQFQDVFVYSHSGEVNFEVEDTTQTIEAIKAELSDGEISELDGIRIDYPESWVSVRASNTEPVLRVIVEGKTSQDREKLYQRVTARII